MSFAMNPYAQAGWADVSGYVPQSNGQRHPAQPFNPSPYSPTYGALPHPSEARSPELITFTFVSGDEDIHDSALVGPTNQPHFDIRTESTGRGPMVTTISRPNDTVYCTIHWTSEPVIHIPSMNVSGPASRWISSSREYPNARFMTVNGRQFVWERTRKGVYLYNSTDSRVAKVLAKFRRAGEYFVLDLTPEALHLGILEPAVAALMLLTTHRQA